MAIDKDFVIKNGIEVNEDLIYGNATNSRVGIGTTIPDAKLDVRGDLHVSGIASVGLAVTSHDAFFTGFCTAIEGFNIGLGGTIVNINADNKKVGVNSTDPTYTTDIRGPVSTGTTALFVFGDLEVTGNIRATELFGQISDGGTVGFATVSVSQRLTAPDSEVYTLFNIEQSSGTDWNFIAGGVDPAGIGFTQNTLNPDIFLQRGRKYHFDVNASGFPFAIKTDTVANTSNFFIDGITNNGAQVGIVTFKVPYNAPSTLFYQATNTSGMGGQINITGIFTGGSTVLNITGVATINQAEIKNLTVTGFTTLAGAGASITNLEVVGFTTLGRVETGDINSTGVITATKFVGLAVSSSTLMVSERNDSVDYQVGFVTANGTRNQDLFIDTDNAQFTYNPSSSTLTASNFVGDLNGTARRATDIQVDEKNDNVEYQVGFITANGNTFQRLYIDTDDANLTYNPSAHRLTAGSFKGNLTGIADTSNTSLITENDTQTAARVIFAAGTGNQSLLGDNEFTYNASANVLSAGGFVGRGTTLTQLNASNLTVGTVPGDRGVTAGSGDSSFVEYNGTTKTAGQWYGGTTNPDGTTRLNYDGDIHATEFHGALKGNADTSTQVFVTENDTETAGRLVFVDATGSNQSLLGDNDLRFNANTNALTIASGTVQCAGDGSNFGNTTLDETTVESLNVTNNTASTNRTTGAVTVAGGVGIVGDLNVGGDITAFATSDERLKENVEPIPNALLKMKKISGNTFDWKEESSRSGSECGVIAQEIESLGLPGLVTTRDDGHKAVRYEKLVPLLIEAIKELTERVQELEK